jgi:hypothetical protein
MDTIEIIAPVHPFKTIPDKTDLAQVFSTFLRQRKASPFEDQSYLVSIYKSVLSSSDQKNTTDLAP